MMVAPLEKRYLDETFTPVVQAGLLDEPKLSEDGYKVTALVLVEAARAFTPKKCLCCEKIKYDVNR